MAKSLTPLLLATLLSLLPIARGADDIARRAEVEAATAQAFDRLRQSVLNTSLENHITVERMIADFGAQEQFDAFLHTARDLGGTRWVDEQTAQVRLEIPGDEIAKFLEGLAQKQPAKLRMPIKSLREGYKRNFMHRNVAATGTSTAASVAERLRPDRSQLAWRTVSDKERVAAIHAARHSAVERVLDSLQPIEWDANHRLGDALASGAARDALAAWLVARPITGIEFRDDLTVQISLAAAPADLVAALHAIGERHPQSLPATPAQWERLRLRVEQRSAPAIGRAVAVANEGPDVGALPIPDAPPAWVHESLEANGASPAVGGSKLRTARAAQELALESLKQKVEALPYTAHVTLGQAARRDPRLADALGKSLQQSRIERVEYDVPTPGSARAFLTLDLQDVWKEITGK